MGAQGNTSYISAMATCNSSGSGSGSGVDSVTSGSAASSSPSSLRVFLGFWGNPDPCCNATARSVRVTVKHRPGEALPTKALLHVLDDDHGNVQALWQSLGAPDKPSPAQLAQLKAASAAGVVPATVAKADGAADSTVVSVTMAENAAVVVEYL